MPAKRKYNVKGSKDFIVLSGIFFFLCLWSIKDAWFTSPKMIEKHPQEVAAAFETSGLVEQLHVREGDSVGEGQLLAELRRGKMKAESAAAKKTYTEAKNKHTLMDEALRNAEKNGATSEGIAEIKQSRDDAQAAMAPALKQVNLARERIAATELRASSKGVVKEVRVPLYASVDTGETVMVIDPKDHFYLFNKSLAIFSFIAFWVFLGIHILAL